MHQDQDPVVPVLDVPVPAGSDSSALPDINDGCPVASTGVYYNVTNCSPQVSLDKTFGVLSL